MLETPALEIVIALVGIQLVALLYLYYRTDGASSATATAEEPTDDPVAADPLDETGEVVECNDCGAENDPSYRYCRRCVADLAGGPAPGSRDRSPQGRLF